jgi:iron complex transport system permease protein
MQGMFRNPLADPGLLGVSSGAAVGATFMIVLGGLIWGAWFMEISHWLIPLGAFLGALVTTLVVTAIARKEGHTAIATMLLAGVAISAISGALIGLLVFMADDNQLRDLTFWGMGSLGNTNWTSLSIISLPILLCIALIIRWGSDLNALILGESAAGHLGIRVETLKLRLIILVTLGVGCAVAMSGGIGFVGLVIPHLLRLMWGADHRLLLPASALCGGLLVLVADMVARTIASPAELPIGVLTAILGGPFFIWLLLRGRASGQGTSW